MKTCHPQRLFRLPPHAPQDQNGWSQRHRAALLSPARGFETAWVLLLKGWLEYADVHAQRYAGAIGQDGVLGPAWGRIGAALRELLNGELGRLDRGTLDGLLVETLQEQGFDPDLR